jgi:tripeptidyl-peptidase I
MHLSSAEVEDLIKPTAQSLDLVQEWLHDHDIPITKLKYSAAKDWIKVSLSVHQVERLLDTRYQVYRHEDGSHLVRTAEWSLPSHLHDHVVAVQPTNAFFRNPAQHTNIKPVVSQHFDSLRFKQYRTMNLDNMTTAEACNVNAVTPLCLRTLYGTLDYAPQVPGQNRIGMTNYLGEVSNRSDTALFLQQFRPDAISAANTFNTVVIAGGDNQQTPLNATEFARGKNLEGNLDAQTILGIGYPTPMTTYNTGGSPPFEPDAFTPTNTNEPFLVWLQYMLSQPDASIPQVISTSYGDVEQTVPPSYAQTVCAQFAQLGARGVSLLFASGDEGVGSSGDCITNDGQNASTFLASFPSTCPYITSVGGTKGFKPEVAAFDRLTQYASGGGFSNYFTRPQYQDDAVTGYLSSLGDQYVGLYNSSGRGYPDLSAQSERFVSIWNGDTTILDGTSAATPAAAAIISLINDALLAAGRSPLGFLNPWLYAEGYMSFTDILGGSAVGCDSAGFPAGKGWDPVTGHGTPVSSGPDSLHLLNILLTVWLFSSISPTSRPPRSNRPSLASRALPRSARCTGPYIRQPLPREGENNRIER